MKHSLLSTALAALLAAPLTATAAAPDLFISEYIEGSSFNKAIELHNATGATIDLAAGGYRLELYSNGAVATSASLALTGTIASGEVLVLCHTSAGAAIQAQCDVRNNSVINFNGDDAVVLRKAGAVIDAVGQVGNDPGTEWEATADNTLQRKPGFCGDTNAGDAFAPALEWNVFGIDTFAGLGSHVATCDGGEPPPVATALTIAQIQGSGHASGHIDALVETEGVVTALKFNNGFFLQSLAPDADPATSEAVFVFTSSAPTVHVGDRIKVVATVKEFVPGSNLNQLPITELVSPRIEVLARGEALPAAVELTQAELNAGNLPGTLERLEGMRVSVAEARVVEASDGSIDENDATSRTGGVFQVVLPDTARPFREPGIGVMDVIPIPAGKAPPRFDTNQERLMVRSWGQIDSQPLAVDVDAVVTGLVGVLDYNSGTWALTPDPDAALVASGGKAPVAVTEAGGTELTIGSFNLLRFFDDVADGNGAVRLTTAAMNARLAKTSAAICDWLKAPDILGVVEVENLNILGKLATQLNEGCARAPGYVPYLAQGNDVGGINVGFLVSTRDNGAGAPRVSVGEVVQYGKDATLANPDGSTSLLNDRPPLLLQATVRNANGASYPVTVVANHLRSLGDIDSSASGSNGWATTGDRVRGKRAAQAAYLAGLVHSLQESRPDDKLVLLGDFNAFEFNDGYVDVMGIVRGQPVPEDQVLTWAPSPITSPLVDGSELIADPAERYSYVFAGNAQTLDHVLVNEALLLGAANARVEHARINADFGVHHFGEAGNALRVSDHDPVRLAIEPPQFRDADLSVTLAGPAKKLHYGRTERFALQVANTGPHAAWRPVLVLRGDAPVANVAVTAPQGWTCATSDAGGDFELRCQTEQELAAGATAAFAADILVPARPDATEYLTLDAAVGAGSSDPSLGNNNAEYRNRIVGVP